MPNKPARKCSQPGCGGIVLAEVCDRCGPLKTWNWRDDKQRGTAKQRGYDQAWRNRRAHKLRIDPLCEECEREGRVTEATQVHHIVPFASTNDRLRLAWNNLESICEACHARKSQVESRHRESRMILDSESLVFGEGGD